MSAYAQAAVEGARIVQEVILRAMAKKITRWQAAEIVGISDRQMRRWRERSPASAELPREHENVACAPMKFG
jgi:hypothetical protein